MADDNLKQFAEQMGEEHFINANECLFDISYGNEPQERWFKPIQASFKWAMFGRPIVAQRKDGFYAVLDGRHRIVAVRNLFGTDTTFKALVLTGLTQEDEAWMFSHLDIDRRSVPAAETFRSAVIAKERYAIDIGKDRDYRGYRPVICRHQRIRRTRAKDAGHRNPKGDLQQRGQTWSAEDYSDSQRSVA